MRTGTQPPETTPGEDGVGRDTCQGCCVLQSTSTTSTASTACPYLVGAVSGHVDEELQSAKGGPGVEPPLPARGAHGDGAGIPPDAGGAAGGCGAERSDTGRSDASSSATPVGNWRLRQATVADGEFLFALHRESLGAVVQQTYGPWDESEQRRFHESWFAEPERASIVVLDDEPVGVVEARVQADVLYLARLEIVPARQGRGLGSALVMDLVEQARRLSLVAVELHVLERNPGARRLYERLGFTVVGTEPPKVHMRRPVAG